MKNLIDIMNAEKEMYEAIKEILMQYMNEKKARQNTNKIMKITVHAFTEKDEIQKINQ